jgi:hypothetical protein
VVRRFGAVLGFVLLLGCGDDLASNSLSGSLSEIYGLDFENVAVTQLGDTIIVKYYKGSGASTATVIKFTTDLTGLMVAPGKSIDLAELVGGQQRGSLARLVDTPVQLGILRGLVSFSEVPVGGHPLSGEFHVELSDPSGRTLSGKFSGALTILQ